MEFTIKVTDADIKKTKEELGIIGTDDVARYQGLSQALMNRVDEVLNKEFSNLPVLEGIEEILDRLETGNIIRTGEDITISGGKSVDLSKFAEELGVDDGEKDDVKKDADDLKAYIFRIPAKWFNTSEDEEQTPILISAGIVVDEVSGAKDFRFYIASDSEEKAKIAEEFLLNDLTNPETFRLAEISHHLDMIFSEDSVKLSDIASKKHKIFFKAAQKLARKGKFNSLKDKGGVHVYSFNKDDEAELNFMVFENLPIIDSIMRIIIRHIRSEGVALTDSDLKEILGLFNYRNSDEWIEQILNEKVVQFVR